MMGRGRLRRLGTLALVIVVTTPLVALLGPFGDAPPRQQVAESLGFLALFGWWLYLPGLVVYALALPAMLRRGSPSPRVVAVLASPLILAGPLLALLALLVFGSPAATDVSQLDPDASIGLVDLFVLFVIPTLAAALVVPLPYETARAP